MEITVSQNDLCYQELTLDGEGYLTLEVAKNADSTNDVQFRFLMVEKVGAGRPTEPDKPAEPEQPVDPGTSGTPGASGGSDGTGGSGNGAGAGTPGVVDISAGAEGSQAGQVVTIRLSTGSGTARQQGNTGDTTLGTPDEDQTIPDTDGTDNSTGDVPETPGQEEDITLGGNSSLPADGEQVGEEEVPQASAPEQTGTGLRLLLPVMSGVILVVLAAGWFLLAAWRRKKAEE